MLLLLVAIVSFLVVVVVDILFFLFIEFLAALPPPPLIVLPVFVCVVFHTNSAFNSDISAWNTGAVITMAYSKSFMD